MTRFRQLLVALALAVSAALFAVPAAPASANSSHSFCFPLSDESGAIVDWVCVDLVVQEEIPDPDPCFCPWAIDFQEGLILPVDLQREYLVALAESLVLVDRAAQSQDQDEAYKLREQAVDLFGQAATVLGGEQVGLGEVGRAYLKDLKLDPYHTDRLVEGGNALAEGLTFVSGALAGPRPHPWREVALEQLDVAYLNLTRGPVG